MPNPQVQIDSSSWQIALSYPDAGHMAGITIMAGGTPLDGVWPHMDLIVDGQVVESWEVKNNPDLSEYKPYHYPVFLVPGEHTIGVEFTNDGCNDKEDRNLIIPYIKVNDSIINANDKRVQYIFTDGTIIGNDHDRSWMAWAGKLQFTMDIEHEEIPFIVEGSSMLYWFSTVGAMLMVDCIRSLTRFPLGSIFGCRIMRGTCMVV